MSLGSENALIFIAYSSIRSRKSTEHVLVASFLLVLILLDFLLANRDLIDGGFVFRLEIVNFGEVVEGFFGFTES